jgi:drug/metabolite transporter (DMT)-like permease
MFERYKFFAIKLLDASVFTTIINISVLVAFVGSLFLYSETLTAQKLLGGLLIIGALLTVSLNSKAKKSSIKGMLIAVPISIILGLGWMLDKKGAQLFHANTYNILVWAIPVIFIYLPYMKLDEIKTELRITSWKIVLLAGLNVVGYLMQLKALEIAEATRVIPIVQTSTLFTVLLGIILLKERDFIGRKIIAGVMAIIGVFLLI